MGSYRGCSGPGQNKFGKLLVQIIITGFFSAVLLRLFNILKYTVNLYKRYISGHISQTHLAIEYFPQSISRNECLIGYFGKCSSLTHLSASAAVSRGEFILSNVMGSYLPCFTIFVFCITTTTYIAEKVYNKFLLVS